MKTFLHASIGLFIFSLGFSSPRMAQAEQFVLFDKTFTFEKAEAVSTKSHLFVKAEQLGEGTPLRPVPIHAMAVLRSGDSNGDRQF